MKNPAPAGEPVFGSKKFIRPPLLFKLKQSPVAVAVTLLLAATTPLTPSNKFRLKERMLEATRAPIVPSVVIGPVTVPGRQNPTNQRKAGRAIHLYFFS